jgi:membrane protein DedA with SNARE-associated domain
MEPRAADGKIFCGETPTSCIIAEAVAHTIFQLLSEFFVRYGYWAVFFGVMLENVGLPIPGETVLLFAGFLAYQGRMHILPAILTAIGGATIGAALGYVLGHYGGTSIVNRFLPRFPRMAKKYDRSQQTFLKYGNWAVFAARFITGLRVFAGILAGVMRMPFFVFMIFSFAGAVCWAFVIGFAGFLLGNSWDTLVKVVGSIDRIVLAVVVVAAAGLFLKQTVRRRKLS